MVSGKESACNAGDARDMDLIPGLRRSLGGGNGNPLQGSYLGKSMDRGALQAAVAESDATEQLTEHAPMRKGYK